eukprot:1160336-Pelagomonas_calceolata.AAC.16
MAGACTSSHPGPGSRVHSRQLSTSCLQQSLCSPSRGSYRHGGLAPVRKLLRRLFSTNSQAQQQHQSFAAASQCKRREQSRVSVDVSGYAPVHG